MWFTPIEEHSKNVEAQTRCDVCASGHKDRKSLCSLPSSAPTLSFQMWVLESDGTFQHLQWCDWCTLGSNWVACLPDWDILCRASCLKIHGVLKVQSGFKWSASHEDACKLARYSLISFYALTIEIFLFEFPELENGDNTLIICCIKHDVRSIMTWTSPKQFSCYDVIFHSNVTLCRLKNQSSPKHQDFLISVLVTWSECLLCGFFFFFLYCKVRNCTVATSD